MLNQMADEKNLSKPSSPTAKPSHKSQTTVVETSEHAIITVPATSLAAEPLASPTIEKKVGRTINIIAWFRRKKIKQTEIAPETSLTAHDLDEVQRTARLTAYDSTRSHFLTLRQASYEHFDQAVLTLSSAMLTLSIGFIKDIVPLNETIKFWMITSSWGLFSGSILSTLLSYIASRRALDEHLKYAEEYMINLKEEYCTKTHWATRATAMLNWVTTSCFVSAIILTVLFVIFNVNHKRELMSKKSAPPSAARNINTGVPVSNLLKSPPVPKP